MGTNFHTAWTSSTVFTAASMCPALASLDKGITYLKNVIVHCDGEIRYNRVTGVLSWSSTLRILFNREDGQAIQNTVAVGSVTLADNEIAYVDLSETNNAVLTVSHAAISTAAASNFITFNRLVLGYRNTTSDEFFPVYLTNVIEDIVTLASGASVTVDWSKGHKQQITLAHDVAFTHNGGHDGDTLILMIRQNGSVAKIPTWTNNIYGVEITEIIISAILNSENIIGIIYRTGIGYCIVSNVSGYVAP